MGRGPAVGRCRTVSGFTMVELVAVMVILGILSIGTVRFIGGASQGFASSISRGQLAGDTRFAVERLARDVRNAVVEMNFIFARAGDQIRIEHAVQVCKVP